jgi:murein DD-endopeptidase MepM/ murein hydrolase activator NlpD
VSWDEHAHAAPTEVTRDFVMPRKWLPANGRECIRKGRLRGFCQGPRRVPEPYGNAADLAKRLKLGNRNDAARLLIGPAPTTWIVAAKEQVSDPRWAYPLEHSRLLRGLGDARPGKWGGGPRGPRRKPHAGLDIRADEGSSIRAVQNGLVVYSDNGISGYGNLVMVVHPDATVALYGHCRATYVFAGQRVQRGQVIAEVGQTGYANGPHLHLEYRVRGRPRDPTRLFERR